MVTLTCYAGVSVGCSCGPELQGIHAAIRPLFPPFHLFCLPKLVLTAAVGNRMPHSFSLSFPSLALSRAHLCAPPLSVSRKGSAGEQDRWSGTPLQDALSGGHFGAAHLLKAKGAAVPESFGAEAVCTAAGKGDVPKLRMLHSFGQSLDVGDYDERYALHLASAEGRVLAVSFLLGISADPNVKDRWQGTPMGKVHGRTC